MAVDRELQRGTGVRIAIGSWVDDESSLTGRNYVEGDREVNGVVEQVSLLPDGQKTVRVRIDELMRPNGTLTTGIVGRLAEDVTVL